jgi:hypothetical protein
MASRGPTCAYCDGKLLPGLGVSTVEGAQVHDSCRGPYSEIALPHVCPECKGAGKVVTAWDTHYECCHGGPMSSSPVGSFAGCEYCPDAKTIRTPRSELQCTLCDGKGRMKNKPLPVMTQTGWKRS